VSFLGKKILTDVVKRKRLQRERGFAPSFVNYKKGCTRLAAASDKVYQLLAQGRSSIKIVLRFISKKLKFIKEFVITNIFTCVEQGFM
jgi:hypothetical protein